MENISLIKLPDSELEIMQAIWTLEFSGQKHITAASIIENFPEVARLKLTTVLTLITRLQNKGYINVDKIGRSNCCKSNITRYDYQVFVTKDFVNKVFAGNTEELLNLMKE